MTTTAKEKTKLNKYLNPIHNFVGKMPLLHKNDKVYLFHDEISEKSIQLLNHNLSNNEKISTLFLLLSSEGGSPGYGYEASLLLNDGRCKKLVCLVPQGAYSSSTLIACSSCELKFSPWGRLGPIDMKMAKYQKGVGTVWSSCENLEKAYDIITEKALSSLSKCVEMVIAKSGLSPSDAFQLSSNIVEPLTKNMYSKIDVEKLGSQSRSRNLGVEYCSRILQDICGWDWRDARDLSKKLAQNYPSHGFRIKADEVRELGLNVQKPNKDELKLMALVSNLLCNVESYQGFLGKPKVRK